MKNSENLFYSGSPSQITNVTFFIFMGILSLGIVTMIITIPAIIWRIILTKRIKVEITNERLIEKRGVFSTEENELELFRIKDTKLETPFWLSLFKLSNIYLSTSDRSHPNFKIRAIKNGRQVREDLRTAIEARRDAKGVKEVEYVAA